MSPHHCGLILPLAQASSQDLMESQKFRKGGKKNHHLKPETVSAFETSGKFVFSTSMHSNVNKGHQELVICKFDFHYKVIKDYPIILTFFIFSHSFTL